MPIITKINEKYYDLTNFKNPGVPPHCGIHLEGTRLFYLIHMTPFTNKEN